MNPERALGTPPRTRSARRWLVVPAWLAAAWAALFAAVHLYWLAGGTVGLPAGKSVFDNTPLLVIDIIAVPLCGAAAVLALALAGVGPVRRLSSRILLLATWACAVLLVVHALPAVPTWLDLVTDSRASRDLGELDRFSVLVYEPFFATGGLLYGAAAFCSQRRTPVRRPEPRS